tara:strand:- start:3800 stop:5332 length:1533 start_codon:yes stop_codon:yes gene_type:complete
MEEYKVLITTGGIGSRLGSLTNYTNKCLVRVGDKPAISHIIEAYPRTTQFVITLGHFGDYVKQFLTLAYPDKDFTFVTVDNFKGQNSSLGHSILQAKNHLQCPFIFHASDTILTSQDTIPTPDSNWCAGAYKESTSQYRTLNISNDEITCINEKGELNFDYPYIGLCGIKDYRLFWEHLEGLPPQSTLSDVHVINKMLKTVRFEFNLINKWLDIGNSAELKKSIEYFGSNIEVLEKENESIYFFDDFVIKFFSNSSICKNRVARAETLYPIVPKILGSTLNFYKYKKAEGKLFSKSATERSFRSFLDWAHVNLWVQKHKEDFNKDCIKFYIDKSLDRISLYLESNSDCLHVNGEDLPSIKTLMEKVDVAWIGEGIPSQYHGDFILDNIIETPSGFSLIDWRQDFAGDLEVGDIYYDLSKLNHNLTVNHSIIDKGLYDSSPENCHIMCNSTLIACKKILHRFITDKGYDLKKVELLTSIIWINMSPLHSYPFNEFLYNFGKYSLHKALKND